MRSIALGVVLLSLLTVCQADDIPSVSREQHFQDSVWPLLHSKCVSCHGPEKQEGGLRLDSLAAALTGGENGEALVPEKPGESSLIRAVAFDDPDLQMPPKEPLSKEQVALLSRWVADGAIWPEPVIVLFEDESTFVESLVSGDAQARLIREGVHSGSAALAITPTQKFSEQIPGWHFPIRENPAAGEYRYLQWSWKKSGPGAVMIEVATSGKWPDAKAAPGRYIAGLNTTEWAAVSVADEAPSDWSVVSIDLWKDLGDVILTGIAPTCVQEGEALFDAIVLGPTPESVAAYRPGLGQLAQSEPESSIPVGDAFTDTNNPIHKIWKGERLDLWSLRLPQRGPVPAAQGTESTNPIDGFVTARLAEQGLELSTEADRRTLIRRLTFDLTGLPPASEEVEAFVADDDPHAYDKLVSRLLDSPRYGERQARLWLDLVRYADTHGYERDEFRPLAWKYRDYIVRAFNHDKPFDRFVLEQLAGDELVAGNPATPDDADALIATGYLQLGQWDSTAAIFQEEERLRADEQADLTNTTAAAFLGLTMSCCQCHDHKYDPLSQADHYRLRAFFAGVQRRDDLVVALPEAREAIEAHNAALNQEAAPLQEEQSKLDKEKEGDKPRYDELQTRIDEINSRRQHPEVTMGATDRTDPPATHILIQGDFHSPREEVAPGFVSVVRPGPAVIEPPHAGTTGRRLALAKWLVERDNPWTARVFVNRVWQQHFGIGLVATPSDFGYSGARPTHPELLDWLAVEFMESGWSVKQLHRLIVSSATYRQSSRDRAAARSVDGDNHLLWRQNLQRLDAETLRDSLLSVSGLLHEDGGGKPKWPMVPDELLYAQPGIQEALKGEDGGRMQGWFTDPVEDTDVRSLYLVRKRCLPIPFLQAFDLPDTTVSCSRRDSTVVAPQALMLLNSEESIRYAKALAERLQIEVGEVRSQDDGGKEIVAAVFRRALCRAPSDDEAELSLQFLKTQVEKHRETDGPDAATDKGVVDLCRGVLNLNEFAYYD